MFVCCECSVVSGRGLCDGLLPRSEESSRLGRGAVCDQETSKTRRLKPATGLWKNTTTMGCNARKTNKQTTNIAPTCFGPLGPSSESIRRNLAEVTAFVEIISKTTSLKCLLCNL
jgi:hypothetical protein